MDTNDSDDRIEAWQLVTGMCVSIGCILATGCMRAVAVVTGFILADKAKQLTN